MSATAPTSTPQTFSPPPKQSAGTNPTKFAGAPMGSSIPAPIPNPKTSGKAVMSLILAILGLFVFGVILGPIAVCLGTAAKNDIMERPGELKGEGVATAGQIIGVIGTVLSIILIIIFISNQ